MVTPIPVEELKAAHHLLAEYTYELRPVERGYANRTLYINLDDNTFRGTTCHPTNEGPVHRRARLRPQTFMGCR